MFVPHQSIWPATRSLDRQFELAVLPPILQQVTMSANTRMREASLTPKGRKLAAQIEEIINDG